MAKFVTLKAFASGGTIRQGVLLYLRRQPDFPNPMLKRGRERYFDREDIKRFLKQTHWVVRC